MYTVNQKINNVNYVCEIFDNVLELKKINESRPINSAWQQSNTEKILENKKSWAGGLSLSEAYDSLIYGYKKGWRDIKDNIELSTKKEQKRKNQYYNDVVGYGVDIGLYTMGVPTCMINSKRDKLKKSKVINIYYDCGVSHYVTKSQISQACINLANVIVSLEKKGYRVNLSVSGLYYDTSDKSVKGCCVNIKKASEKLNIYKALFPIMHVSFLRVVTFDYQDKSPYQLEYLSGRGTPIYQCSNSEEKIQNLQKILCNNKGVLINFADCQSMDSLLEKMDI